LAPGVIVGTVAHRVFLLDMTSVAIDLLGRSVDVQEVDDSAISAGLDAIFRGYPAGLEIH
jgi:hypothetical protein